MDLSRACGSSFEGTCWLDAREHRYEFVLCMTTIILAELCQIGGALLCLNLVLGGIGQTICFASV
jgi:hypothetical protein